MVSSAISLDDVIDGQRMRRSTIVLLAVATLAMMSDGFDLSAIGYVGPELVKAWHIGRAQLVPVFSAGIVGLLVGAPLLGFVGDRLGRKTAILIGLSIVGMVTLATMAATSLTQFTVLRFITGTGLGGVIPNVIALVAENSPRRSRGMSIVIVNFGIPAGIALPGLVAATLVPRFGWPALLLVGGLLPLLVAAIAAVLLPESLRYLAQRGDRDAQVRRQVAAMRPDLPIAADASFRAPGQARPVASGSPRGLFRDGLAAITPLLWFALAANQMVNFFALSWLPTLLQSAGASTAQAGVNASLFSLGGLAGGVCLTFIVDRLGIIPMALLFLVGVPFVAAIGMPHLAPAAFSGVIAGAGFCVTGINFSMSATLGMIYPTPVRSLGTGWGQSVGRVGSLAAPLVGGVLLGLQLPLQEVLFAPALALALGAVAAIAAAVLCVRRFGSTRLRETAAPDQAAPRPLATLRPGAIGSERVDAV